MKSAAKLAKNLRRLITAERDVIPFLKSLQPEERNALAPVVLEVFHEKPRKPSLWNSGSLFDGLSASLNDLYEKRKRRVSIYAVMVCCSEEEIRLLLDSNWWIIETLADEVMEEELLSWLIPSWYNQLIEEYADWCMDYLKMVRFKEKGFIQPSEHMIANLLAAIIRSKYMEGSDHLVSYHPERLFEYPETLELHIELLFDYPAIKPGAFYEAAISNAEQHGMTGKEDLWERTFLDLLANGHIGRVALVEKAVSAVTKDLGKWYREFLKALNLTVPEIILHQEVFLTGLKDDNSAVVSEALRNLKKIAPRVQFNQQLFLESAEPLLLEGTQGVIHDVLIMLERIVNNSPDLRSKACYLACLVFQRQNDKTQLRAARLIDKYGERGEAGLRALLKVQEQTLSQVCRDLLADFLR